MRHNYTYDAFGETESQAGATENSYLFAGEQFDRGVGDYYLRDRYYAAEVGRFTRKDTYEGRFIEPLTLNRYLYAHANSINSIDPSGLATLSLSEFNLVQNLQQKLSSIAAPSFVEVVTSVNARILLSGLVIAGATAAYAVASLALLKGAQRELQEKITAAVSASASCGIPLFHYTDYVGMVGILASQEILATGTYKSGGFTHPTGAYATQILPIGPFTQTELRNLYKGGDQSWDVSHFVMMCSEENSFYPTSYPGEWVSPAPYPRFPVPVVTVLSGINLMPL